MTPCHGPERKLLDPIPLHLASRDGKPQSFHRAEAHDDDIKRAVHSWPSIQRPSIAARGASGYCPFAQLPIMAYGRTVASFPLLLRNYRCMVIWRQARTHRATRAISNEISLSPGPTQAPVKNACREVSRCRGSREGTASGRGLHLPLLPAWR